MSPLRTLSNLPNRYTTQACVEEQSRYLLKIKIYHKKIDIQNITNVHISLTVLSPKSTVLKPKT